MDESERVRLRERSVSYMTSAAVTPGRPGAVIRHAADGALELVNLIWGLAPPEPGGRPFTFIRSEGRRFGRRRALVPVADFHLAAGEGAMRRRWRVTPVARAPFYFAAIWAPRRDDWPASYAILTTAANPDIAPFKPRQMAVILEKDRYAWLDHEEAQAELLRPHPRGTFALEQVEGPAGLFDWPRAAAS